MMPVSASRMVLDHLAPQRVRVDTTFDRYLIWVKQQPLEVIRHLHGSMPENLEEGWLLSATLQGIEHVTDGQRVVIMREDSPFFDYQPSSIAVERLGITGYDTLTSQAFDEFADLYTSGFGNIERMALLVGVIEKYAPKLRFMPKHLQHLLADPSGNYGTLPRMFLRSDLSLQEALVRVGQSQLPKTFFEARGLRYEDFTHTGGGWYAASLENAVALKLHYPGEVEVFDLSPK